MSPAQDPSDPGSPDPDPSDPDFGYWGVCGVCGTCGTCRTWGILEKLFSRPCDEWLNVGKCLTNVKNAKEQVYKTVVAQRELFRLSDAKWQSFLELKFMLLTCTRDCLLFRAISKDLQA